jgi:hypothetical protein
MFRFSPSPLRGLLVIGVVLCLLTTLLPTLSSARNPYEMQIATEGDPGDGVLEPAAQPEGQEEDSTATTTGTLRDAPSGSLRFLLPRVIWLGPGQPVFVLSPYAWPTARAAAPPLSDSPSISRGW